MADNFVANPGIGGDTFKADDLSGIKVPGSKIVLGDDNTDGGYVSTGNPLPVTGIVAATVSGSVEVSNDAGNPLPVSGPLTDTQLRATAVPVSGTVTVGNASIAVTGPLTDTQLRASAVPVSAVQSGTWNIGSITTLPTLANVTTVGAVTNITNWFPSVISTVNSTTTNLGISAVFTGTSEDVSNYADTQVYVFANQASATDGLSLQQSSDGTNWDITDTYTIAANTGKTFSVQPAGRFFRVVYTNGTVAQTAFRLQVIYHRTMAKPSSQRPADGMSNENDLEEMQSWGMLFNGTTWDRARGDATNGAYVQVKSSPTSGTATLSNVAASATSVTLLAANAGRKGATIQNDSSAILYVKFGTTASTTSYTIQMAANSYYEVPFAYTGRMDGIWASATGNARITELT